MPAHESHQEAADDGYAPEAPDVQNIANATPEQYLAALEDVHDEANQLHIRGGVAPRSTRQQLPPQKRRTGSVRGFSDVSHPLLGDGTLPPASAKEIARGRIDEVRDRLGNMATDAERRRVHDLIARTRAELEDSGGRINGTARPSDELEEPVAPQVGIPREVRERARKLSIDTGATHKIVPNGDGTFTIEKVAKRSA